MSDDWIGSVLVAAAAGQVVAQTKVGGTNQNKIRLIAVDGRRRYGI